MKLPSAMFLNSALCQIVLGGSLGPRSWADFRNSGMRRASRPVSLIAYTISISVMAWYMCFGPGPRQAEDQGPAPAARDVLRDPEESARCRVSRRLQSVLSISIFTHMLAAFGTAGARRFRPSGRAARIPADVAVFFVRHRLGSDDRLWRSALTRSHGARRVGLDCGASILLPFGRRDRPSIHRDLSGPLGQHLHGEWGCAGPRAGNICR